MTDLLNECGTICKCSYDGKVAREKTIKRNKTTVMILTAKIRDYGGGDDQ